MLYLIEKCTIAMKGCVIKIETNHRQIYSSLFSRCFFQHSGIGIFSTFFRKAGSGCGFNYSARRKSI